MWACRCISSATPGAPARSQKNRFEGLVAAVEEHLAAASEETVVWIDVFAVNQHSDTHYQPRDVAAFKDVVRAAAGGTVVVMGDIAAANPALRAWCVYEWAASLATHGSDGLHLQLSQRDRAELVAGLDVERAECFKPEDKAFILADVVSQHGSTAAFNQLLRLQLLLEPTSYGPDLRRLLDLDLDPPSVTGPGPGPGRGTPTIGPSNGPAATVAGDEGKRGAGKEEVAGAEGRGASLDVGPEWEWDWGPVEEWLGRRGRGAPGGGGGSGGGGARLLAIVGGAGEGKSTISAALLGPSGPLGASGGGGGASGGGEGGAAAAAPAAEAAPVVCGYHFCKAADVRRREPLRIIKSLAYQLAVRLPAVRDALLRLDPVAVTSLREDQLGPAFEALLMRPLSDHLARAREHLAWRQEEDSSDEGRSSEQQVVLVLDALDEADPPEERRSERDPTAAATAVSAEASDTADGVAAAAPATASASSASTPSLAASASAAAAAVEVGVPRVCGNAALTLLTSHLARLPAGAVRFLVTTRPDAATGQALPCLARTFGGGGSGGGGGVLQLAPGQLRRRRGGPAAAALEGVDGGGSGQGGGGGTAVSRGAGSAPLCRRLEKVCLEMGLLGRDGKGPGGRDQAEADRTSAPDSLRRLATDSETTPAAAAATNFTGAEATAAAGGGGDSVKELYDMYGLIFDAAFSSYSPGQAAAAAALLSVLLAAAEPLSQAFLEQMGLLRPSGGGGGSGGDGSGGASEGDIGGGGGGVTLASLPGGGRLFRVDEHRVHLMHKSLADFLLSASHRRSRAGAAGCGGAVPAIDPRVGHWLIGRHLASERSLAAPSPYATRYLVHHLAESAAAAKAPAAAAATSAAAAGTDGEFAVSPAAAAAAVGGAAGDTPSALLDQVLSDLRFLAKVFATGNVPRVIAALGALPPHAHTGLSADALRWLRVCLYETAAAGGGGGGGAAAAAAAAAPPLDDVAAREAELSSVEALARSIVVMVPVGSPLQAVAEAWRRRPWRTERVLPWRPPYSAWTALNMTLKGHVDEVNAVAWSPDGRQLLSAGADGTLRAWDAATGAAAAALPARARPLRCAAWSPDGRRLASGGCVGAAAGGGAAAAGSMHLWDVATGQCSGAVAAGEDVSCLSWSADGAKLATASPRGTCSCVLVWDAATGALTGELPGPQGVWVWGVAWRPDGRALAAAGSGGTLRLWELSDVRGSGSGGGGGGGSEVAPSPPLAVADSALAAMAVTEVQLEGHAGDVNAVGWSWDGRLLASAGSDRSVRLWDARRGVQLGPPLQGHSDSVMAVAWRPPPLPTPALTAEAASGRGCGAGANATVGGAARVTMLLASAGCDRVVRLWEVTMAGGSAPGSAGRVSAGGGSGGSAGGASRCAGALVPELAVARCVAVLEGSGGRLCGVAWRPDGLQLAGACADGTVRVWDVDVEPTVEEEITVEQHPGSSREPGQLELHHQQQQARGSGGGGCGCGSGCGGGGAAVHGGWDIADSGGTAGDAMRSSGVAVVSAPRISVCWSPDGARLAGGCPGGVVSVWNPAAAACVAALYGHTCDISSVTWSPDGARLASGGGDETVRLWDVRPAAAAAASSGGNPGACCCVGVFTPGQLPGPPAGWVFSIAWSPDGGRLATGTADGVVRVLDAASGACTAALAGHVGAVLRVAWAPDGRTLASVGSDDGLVVVWDVVSGTRVAALRVAATAAAAAAGLAALGFAGSPPPPMWAAAMPPPLSPHMGVGFAAPSQLGFAAPPPLMDFGEPPPFDLAPPPPLDFAAPPPPLFDDFAAAAPPMQLAIPPPSAPPPFATEPVMDGDLPATFGNVGIGAPGVVAFGQVSCIAWSTDGLCLASNDAGGVVRLWDPAGGWRCRTTLTGHTGHVYGIAWSPDGRRLASGGEDRTLRVWRPNEGDPYGTEEERAGAGIGGGGSGWREAVLEGHSAAVESVAWRPDGRKLASGGADGTVRLWGPAVWA